MRPRTQTRNKHRSRLVSSGRIIQEAKRLLAAGDTRAALLVLAQGEQSRPANAQILHLLGESQAVTGQLELAVRSLQRAAELEPNNARFCLSLAEALMLHKPADSIPHFLEAIKMGAREPYAFWHLSEILIAQNQPEQALEVSDQALAAHPTDIGILKNRTRVFEQLCLYENACQTAIQLTELHPADSASWSNLCDYFRNIQLLEESERCGRTACLLSPADGYAHFALAYTLLLAGKYEEGFREYEWRWQSVLKKVSPERKHPAWDGTLLNGARILLWAEQGVGDVIQFARYAPLVKKAGGQVLLGVPESMAELMSWSSEPFEIVTPRTTMPLLQFQCPLLSLPIYVGMQDEQSIPPPVTFAIPSAAREKWQKRLGERSGVRVALVWAGNSTHKNDYNRSLPLQSLAPLLKTPGARFFSLQVGASTNQIVEAGVDRQIEDLSPWLVNFSETAAALSEMDLLISVDTSVAISGELSECRFGPCSRLPPIGVGRSDATIRPGIQACVSFGRKQPVIGRKCWL